jgi:hypothetical protein
MVWKAFYSNFQQQICEVLGEDVVNVLLQTIMMNQCTSFSYVH